MCNYGKRTSEKQIKDGFSRRNLERTRLWYLCFAEGFVNWSTACCPITEKEDSGDSVPFDLNTFKYVQISQAAEIQGRLTPEIKAILEEAGAVLEGETS